MASSIIVYETPEGHYVTQDGRGLFRIHRHSGTHAEVMGTYHFPDDPDGAFRRAKERVDSWTK